MKFERWETKEPFPFFLLSERLVQDFTGMLDY